MKIAIVHSEFNKRIVDELYAGTYEALGSYEYVETITYSVPGALEIPLVTKKIIQSVDSVICLGVVIRGETDHYDYVCSESIRQLSQLSTDHEVPIINGILTTENVAQAEDRAYRDKKNNGKYYADTAVYMVNLVKTL